VFDHKHKRWYLEATDNKESYWLTDEYFSEPPIQGSFEQLTPTALARWKKENKPETIRTENTPTASPKVSYRESAQQSGESDSEQEEEDPFSEEEKEEELEYTPGVISITILTIEQQWEDEKSAEVIAALSLKTELKPTLFSPLEDVGHQVADPRPIFFKFIIWAHTKGDK
jgi:hypothetical protein